jgi:SAM-dependent methyltransferase
MLDLLEARATASERMDGGGVPEAELAGAYRRLRALNRLFAAAAPIRIGVERLWADAGKPDRLSVLDVGAGSGDVNRALLRWAERNRVTLSIRLVDVREEACREARRLFRGEERVEVGRGDLFALPERAADIVTATQFVHHFGPAELPAVVRRMLDVSRIGVVLNDLRRHIVPWAAVWLTARLITRNRCIRHDGPLSVARGFRDEDWDRLAKDGGFGELRYARKAPYRYVVTIRKLGTDKGGESAGGQDG